MHGLRPLYAFSTTISHSGHSAGDTDLRRGAEMEICGPKGFVEALERANIPLSPNDDTLVDEVVKSLESELERPIVGEVRKYLEVCSGGIRASSSLEFDCQVADLPEMNSNYHEIRKLGIEGDGIDCPWPASSASFLILGSRRGEWWGGSGAFFRSTRTTRYPEPGTFRGMKKACKSSSTKQYGP